MAIECRILLGNDTKTYSSGETIQGQIIVVNDRLRNFEGLKLEIHGECNTTIIRGDRRSNRESTEVLLDETINVFGNDGRETQIPQGLQYYSFQYVLPLELPSSYEDAGLNMSAHGKISYEITSTLKTRTVMYAASTKFNVTGHLDLNSHPGAQNPVVLTKSKRFTLCCVFPKGDLSFVFKMPKRGFVGGELVPFQVDINNHSSRTAAASVSIMRRAQYQNLHTPQASPSVEVKEICKVVGPTLPPGTEEIWNSNNILQIPQYISPTKLGGPCQLIHVSYELQVKLIWSLFSVLEARTPIVIGTIPFGQSTSVTEDPPPSYKSLFGSSFNF